MTRRDMQGREACGWSEAEGTGREGKPGIARLQMGFAPKIWRKNGKN